MNHIDARVVRVEPDYLHLSVQKQSGCSGCKQQNDCVLNWSDPTKTEMIKISSQQKHNAGDTVRLKCDDRSLLRLIISLFAPAILFLLAAGTIDYQLDATRLGEDDLITGMMKGIIYVSALVFASLTSRLIIHIQNWKEPEIHPFDLHSIQNTEV